MPKCCLYPRIESFFKSFGMRGFIPYKVRKMKMFDSNKISYEWAVIIVCLVLLLPIFIISFYSRPSADDYAYSYMTYKALKNGGGLYELIKAGIETDIYYYNNWQGLYSSALIMAFTPSIFGEKLYFICTYMIILVIFVCIYITIRSFEIIADQNMTRLQRVSFTFLITTSIVLCMPSAKEGLFWYNGAVNYIPFTMAAIANGAAVFSLYYRKRGLQTYLLLGLLTFVSFAISGGNHCSSFSNILILAFLLVYNRKKGKAYVLLPFVSAVVGFYVMYAAPGTEIRQSLFVRNSVAQTVWDVGIHVLDLVMVWRGCELFVILILCIPYLRKFSVKLKSAGWKHVMAAMLCEFVLICGMQSAPYYAGTGFGSGRLTNVLWIVFFIFNLIEFSLFMAVCENHYSGIRGGVYRKKWQLLILAIGGFVVFWSPGTREYATGHECIKELLNGTASVYAYETDIRIQQFRNAGNDPIVVAPLSEKAKGSVLCFTDLSGDPDAYPNAHITLYYDKKVMTAQ